MLKEAREKARLAWIAWRKEPDKKRKAQLFRDYQAARELLLLAHARDFYLARAELLQPYIPR